MCWLKMRSPKRLYAATSLVSLHGLCCLLAEPLRQGCNCAFKPCSAGTRRCCHAVPCDARVEFFSAWHYPSFQTLLSPASYTLYLNPKLSTQNPLPQTLNPTYPYVSIYVPMLCYLDLSNLLPEALAAAGAAAAAGLAVLLATSAAVVTGSARPSFARFGVV